MTSVRHICYDTKQKKIHDAVNQEAITFTSWENHHLVIPDAIEISVKNGWISNKKEISMSESYMAGKRVFKTQMFKKNEEDGSFNPILNHVFIIQPTTRTTPSKSNQIHQNRLFSTSLPALDAVVTKIWSLLNRWINSIRNKSRALREESKEEIISVRDFVHELCECWVEYSKILGRRVNVGAFKDQDVMIYTISTTHVRFKTWMALSKRAMNVLQFSSQSGSVTDAYRKFVDYYYQLSFPFSTL